MNAWLCYLRAVRSWASLESQFPPLYNERFGARRPSKALSAPDSPSSPEKVQCVDLSAVLGVEELFSFGVGSHIAQGVLKLAL